MCAINDISGTSTSFPVQPHASRFDQFLIWYTSALAQGCVSVAGLHSGAMHRLFEVCAWLPSFMKVSKERPFGVNVIEDEVHTPSMIR